MDQTLFHLFFGRTGMVAILPLFYFVVLESYLIILLPKICLGQVIKKGNILINETFQRGQCTVISTDYLKKIKVYGRTHRYRNGIPKIIHYVNSGSYIASQYTPLVKECMEVNNDAIFVLWNDFTAYRFMIKTYQKYIRLYSGYFAKFAIRLKISDIIRYFILLEFGGVYMDLDTKCQKPFGPVFVNDSCILSREIEEQSQILYNVEYLAMNSWMACVAGHDFFRYLVDHLTIADNSYVLSHTGPIFMTHIFREYEKLLSNESLKNPLKLITVADAYMFSPLSYHSLEKYCPGPQTMKWRSKGCKNLPEQRRRHQPPYNQTVAIHMFLHLGYEEHKGNIRMLNHICRSTRRFHIVWS